MARLLLPLSKTLEIGWNQATNTYSVRLLQGSVYITPKLEMTIPALRSLMCGQPLQLGEWVRLSHSEQVMNIAFKKEREMTIKWTDFMGKAREARGTDPLEGWKEAEGLGVGS